MLKKLGLAAAAAVGLSLIATPAFAAPAVDAISPAASTCAGEIARAPELPDAAAADAPMDVAPDAAAPDVAAAPDLAAAPDAAAVPAPAAAGAPFAIPGFPGFFCIPRPSPQCASSAQQSFPWPIPGRVPCSSSFSSFPRPHFLGGGLSALLDACLDLNLGLNVNLRGLRGGSCHSWSPC